MCLNTKSLKYYTNLSKKIIYFKKVQISRCDNPIFLFKDKANFFLRFLFIIHRERQREREHKQGEWEREGRLPTEQGARCGAPSQDPGIMT